MKSTFVAGSTVILASVLFAGTPAFAQVTREQVNAEYAQAVRTGDIVGEPEQGLKLNQMYPDRYPAKQAQAGRTRAEVLAELADAQRTGDIVGEPEQGLKLNQMYPTRYPAKLTFANRSSLASK